MTLGRGRRKTKQSKKNEAKDDYRFSEGCGDCREAFRMHWYMMPGDQKERERKGSRKVEKRRTAGLDHRACNTDSGVGIRTAVRR